MDAIKLQIKWSYFFLLTMATVIVTSGQNVEVGDAYFEIGVNATITCTFDVAPGETVISVYWGASDEEPTAFPISSIIIQYTLSGGVEVPNELYRGRVSMSQETFSLVITPTDSDLNKWYACQASVQGAVGFDAIKATTIDQGVTATENTCSGSGSPVECKIGETLTCTVTGFTPKQEFKLEWNSAAKSIGSQGELMITALENGYFTGSRQLTIGSGNSEIQSVFCIASGRPYMYNTDGQLEGDPVEIEVKESGCVGDDCPGTGLPQPAIIGISVGVGILSLILIVSALLYMTHTSTCNGTPDSNQAEAGDKPMTDTPANANEMK